MKCKYILLLFTVFIISTLLTYSFSLDFQLDSTNDSFKEGLSQLILNGIIVSRDELSSVALLRDDKKRENIILTIGDTIYNFELIQILENRIVFQANNETFQLFLGKSGIIQTVNTAALIPFREKVDGTKTKIFDANKDTVVKKEYFRSYIIKRILDEWKIILQKVVFFPNIVDGKTTGFKITMIPGGSILLEMGIKNNDIILKLNNEEVMDISYLSTLIDKYKNDKSVEITIERSGKKIKYLYLMK